MPWEEAEGIRKLLWRVREGVEKVELDPIDKDKSG